MPKAGIWVLPSKHHFLWFPWSLRGSRLGCVAPIGSEGRPLLSLLSVPPSAQPPPVPPLPTPPAPPACYLMTPASPSVGILATPAPSSAGWPWVPPPTGPGQQLRVRTKQRRQVKLPVHSEVTPRLQATGREPAAHRRNACAPASRGAWPSGCGGTVCREAGPWGGRRLAGFFLSSWGCGRHPRRGALCP